MKMDREKLSTTVEGKHVFEGLHSSSNVQVCSQLESPSSSMTARIDKSTGMLQYNVENGNANGYANITPEEFQNITKDLSRFNDPRPDDVRKVDSSAGGRKNRSNAKEPDKDDTSTRLMSLVSFNDRVVAKKLEFSLESPSAKSMVSSSNSDDEDLDSDQAELWWQGSKFDMDNSSGKYPWTPLTPLDKREVSSHLKPSTIETFVTALRALFGTFFKTEQSLEKAESAINELREACGLQSISAKQMEDAVKIALESLSYRIAELKGWIRAVECGKRPGILADEFLNPDVYREWQQTELSELKQILNEVCARPQFESYVQLRVHKAEHLRARGVTCARVLCCCLFRTSPMDHKNADPYARISFDGNARIKILSNKRSATSAHDTKSNPMTESSQENESDIVEGSLNPEWNKCWELYMTKKSDQIKIEVRDADLPFVSKVCVPQAFFFNGRTMGEVSLSISDIPGLYQSGADITLDLVRKGKTAGKIHVTTRKVSFLRHKSQPKRLDLIGVPTNAEFLYETLTFRKCSQQILDSVAEHYRIRPIVQVMSEARSTLSFELQVPFCLDTLKALTDKMRRLCSDILDNQLTVKEIGISRDLFQDVMQFVRESFMEYKTVFTDDADVEDGFQQLQLLMGLATRYKPETTNLAIPIRQWIVDSIKKRSKEIIEGRGTNFTASTFTQILKEIEAEVTGDFATYYVAVPKEVDLGRTSLRIHYEKFQDCLEGWLKSSPAPLFNKDFIVMVSSLRKFHDLITENGWRSPANKIDIDDLVEGFLVDWFDGLRAQIIIWVRKTLDFDHWEPLSKTIGVRYAQSLVDVFSIISQFIDEALERLNLMEKPSIRLFYLLDESIYGALKVYAIRLQSKLLQGIEDGAKHLEECECLLPPSLCTLLSTLYAIPFHIEDLFSSESIVTKEKWTAPKLDSLSSRLSEDIVEIISALSDQVRKRLKANIVEYLNSGRKVVANLKLEDIQDEEVQKIGFSTKMPEELRHSHGDVDVILESVWSMIEQLKTSFINMNEYLEPKIFLYCLFQLWKLFLSVFEEQISNQDLDPEPCTFEDRDLLFRIFMPVLWNLFSQGLEESLMTASSRKLSKLILTSREDTHALMQNFWALWADQREDDVLEIGIDEPLEPSSSFIKAKSRSLLDLPTLENVENSKEQKLTPLDILRLLNQRIGDDEAESFVSGQIDLVESNGLSILFNWPSTEDVHAKINAKSSLGKEGVLYVTKNYVAFSSFMSSHFSANDNTKLLRIVDMTSAHRLNKSITILTKSREGHLFQLGTDEEADKILVMIADRSRTSLKKSIDDHRKANPVTVTKSYFGFRHRRHQSESATPTNNRLLAQEILSSNGNNVNSDKPLAVFSCLKRGLIHYRPGILTIQPGMTTFIKALNKKQYSIPHHLVSSIEVVKFGLREEGISICFQPDGKVDLTKFDGDKPIEEICAILQRLILP